MKSINSKLHCFTRNILLSILIAFLGTFFLSSLVISKEVDCLKNDIYESLDTVATIQGKTFYETHKDTFTYYDAYNEYKSLINEMAKENVKFYSVNYMLEYCNILNVYGRSEKTNDTFNFDYDLGYYPFYDGNNYSEIELIGTNTPELIDEMTNHISLTDGRYFTKEEIENENVAIIPNNLINENGKKIEIGDFITVETKISGPDIIRDELYDKGFKEPTIRLKVIGMYEVIDTKHDVPPYAYSTRVYTSNQIVEDFSSTMIKSIEKFIHVDDLMKVESEYYFPYYLPNTILPPYFLLNSYEEVNEFKTKCEQLLNNTIYIKDYYQVVTTNETIERIIEPMEKIEKFASIILKVSFLSIGILLLLIIGLFIKNDTHEIAVYKALGMKNNRIILKFCGEILLAVMIGFVGIKIFATPVSSWISNKIIQSVEIEVNNQENNDDWSYFESGQYLLDPQQIENKNVIEDFNVNVTDKEYSVCFVYILIVSLIGCVYSIVKILKTNVKNILM